MWAEAMCAGALRAPPFFISRHIQDGFEAANSGAAGPTTTGEAADAFFNRTARLMYDGTFYKDYFVRIETEAVTGTNTGALQLKDVWLGWKPSSMFSVKAGQMKGPFSQE